MCRKNAILLIKLVAQHFFSRPNLLNVCLALSWHKFFACNDIICVGNFDRAFGLLTAAKHIFTIGTHSELISRRINNVVLHHVGADRGHTVGRRQRLLLYHTSAGWLAIDIVNIKAAFFTPRH